MAEIRIPSGYSHQPTINFQEVSKGERPAITEQMALWLPVVQLSAIQNEWHVVLAGTIVAHQGGFIVPANGGAAQDVSYTASDVTAGTYSVTTGSAITAAGTVTDALTANLPVGWAWHHMFSRVSQVAFTNYDLMPNVSTLNDYVVELPLIWSEQTTGDEALVDGCLVKPLGSATWNKNGAPVRYIDATDSAEQICGRVLKLDDITVVDSLDKVRTVNGLGLSGDGTSGIEHWLSATHEGGSVADHKAIIAIDLM